MALISRRNAALALLACAGSVFIPSRSAHACSPMRCSPGAFLPRSGTLPANELELFWRRPRAWDADGGVLPELRVLRVTEQGRAELPITLTLLEPDVQLYRVAIDRELPEGTELVFETDEICPAMSTLTSSVIRVDAPAGPAESLGTLQVVDTGQRPLSVWTRRGSCFVTVSAAYADLDVQLSDSARPFADVLAYSLLVDGQQYRSEEQTSPVPGAPLPALGESVAGRGKDRVYRACDGADAGAASSGLAEGIHHVRMIGLLPDGRTLESDEVSVELRCELATGAGDAGADAQVAKPESADSAVVREMNRDASATPAQRDPDEPIDEEVAEPTADDVAEPTANRTADAGACSTSMPVRAGAAAEGSLSFAFVLLALRSMRRKRRS